MATLAPSTAPTANTLSGALPAIGRVAIAAIFLLSGISKIQDPAYATGYIQSVGLPLPTVALIGAIAVEVLGGIALILGYRTRAVAAVLAVFSLATAFIFHSAFSDPNQFIHFFKNIAMAGGLAQVVAFGAGSLSLDARRR